MPQQLEINIATGSTPKIVSVPVATEEELLEFANRVRQAGGADALKALLPSRRSAAESCLIANALNFDCSVDWAPKGGSSREQGDWYMTTNGEVGKNIESSMGLKVSYVDSVWNSGVIAHVKLPEDIGNAAAAFDQGVAFQEYAEEPEYPV